MQHNLITKAEQLAEYVQLSNQAINLADAKNRLSQLVSELTADAPVLLNVRNKPKAAIVEIESYIDLLTKAEAYEHMLIADGAEAGQRFTLEEGRAWLRQRREERQAARQKGI